MTQRTHAFHVIQRPPGSISQYSRIVVDECGRPHLPLTRFAQWMYQGFSDGTARTYLNVLLPYFTYLATDSWRQQRRDLWDSPPEAIQESVRDYLVHQLHCKVRPQTTYAVVFQTAQSPSTVRIFLSALKKFYSVAQQEGRYLYSHPLTDTTRCFMQGMEREERGITQPRARMPQVSGVEEPRSRRDSENYFRLADGEWVPHPIDDPTLHKRLLEGVTRAHLCLRDQIVIRIAYESGARIREILRLTVGDWRKRGCSQEATAFSKGSRERRVKVIRFSPETARMLNEYVNTQRRSLDPERRRLEHLADSDVLFLSQRRKPYDYEAFKPHWYTLCKVVGIDLNIHGLRHWYVTQTIRTICETAKSAGDITRGKEDLVRYMAWRSSETLKAYEHYFQAQRHAQIQDQLHQRLYEQARSYLNDPGTPLPSQIPHASSSHSSSSVVKPVGEQRGWDTLLTLGGEKE